MKEGEVSKFRFFVGRWITEDLGILLDLEMAVPQEGFGEGDRQSDRQWKENDGDFHKEM